MSIERVQDINKWFLHKLKGKTSCKGSEITRLFIKILFM